MENESIGTTAGFWSPVFRGIAVIGASCGFIAFLSRVLSGRNALGALSFFVAGTVALLALNSVGIIGEGGANKSSQRRTPWSLIALGVITGVGFNWTWIFLAFSRRYAFFSPQVVGATGFIMAFYAVVAFLVGRITGRNWRMALLVFAIASSGLGAIVLRLIA